MKIYCKCVLLISLISIKYRDNQSLEIFRLKIKYQDAEKAWNREYKQIR